jgi:hypothetical protein
VRWRELFRFFVLLNKGWGFHLTSRFLPWLFVTFSLERKSNQKVQGQPNRSACLSGQRHRYSLIIGWFLLFHGFSVVGWRVSFFLLGSGCYLMFVKVFSFSFVLIQKKQKIKDNPMDAPVCAAKARSLIIGWFLWFCGFSVVGLR